MSASVVRDKEFAKRLATAVENNPHAPSGHGRGRWVMRRMLEEFNLKVSPEAVRKWFSGEARPRPELMSKLARLLEVDEAWLSLAITPTATPLERKKLNALTNGAVNLVAAQIQLAGGNIAFPDEDQDDGDLYAIVRGKQHAVTVRLCNVSPRFTLSVNQKAKTVIAVVPTKHPTTFEFIRVPNDLIEQFGRHRGGFVEIDIEHSDKTFSVNGQALPVIKSFDNLDGQAPKGVPEAAKRALQL